jgi:hypothetical protein
MFALAFTLYQNKKTRKTKKTMISYSFKPKTWMRKEGIVEDVVPVVDDVKLDVEESVSLSACTVTIGPVVFAVALDCCTIAVACKY